MNTPAFFDTIHYSNIPLAGFADNYFFLQGISNRLGFRRFSILTNANRVLTLQLLPQSKTQTKDLIKTILKIVSYMTIILPTLMLAVKGVYRLKRSFRVDVTKAQLFLDGRWKEYKSHPYHIVRRTLFDRLQLIETEKRSRNNWSTGINENDSMGNPLLAFEKDPESLFVTMRRNRLDKPENVRELGEILKAAFATGKRFVGIPIGHPKLPHGLAAAFSRDGRFRIIDSLCDGSVDVSRLAQQLNAACILDSAGQPLKFRGEYINTHLQKAGGECGSFALLYLHQILKKRDLDAFEEVNGAFAEGKLKRYEDYAAIGSCKRLRDASSIPDASVAPFMLSWAHRRLGLSIDSWQNVMLQDIIRIKAKDPLKTRNSSFCHRLDDVNWEICTIGKETFNIRPEHRVGKQPYLIRDATGNERAITPETAWTPTTRLGQLIPEHGHAVILHDRADSKLTVLKLQPGEILFAR